MMEQALWKSSGWLITRAWVIMPPMEAPTTWALAMPNAPSSAAPSSAMSSIR